MQIKSVMSIQKSTFASLFNKKDANEPPASATVGVVGKYLEFETLESFILHLRLLGVNQCKYGTVNKRVDREVIYYGVASAAFGDYVAICGKKLLSATLDDLELESRKIEDLLVKGSASFFSLFHASDIQVQQGIWRIHPPSYLT